MDAPALPGAAIDRIAPTLRPEGRVVMHQSWSHLLFLHWPIEVEALRPLIPAGLEVDTFDGRAYIGLVPFTMHGIRPVWAPSVPWLSRFHEVNVRTYVHHAGCDPGVWFFSLDAANPVAVRLARRLWRLPYYLARMGLRISASSAQDCGPEIEYTSTRAGNPKVGCSLRYRVRGEAAGAVPGSLDHFLIERYWLYTRSGHRLLRGQVHHPTYPVRQAELLELDETLIAASGVHRPAGPPPLIHYAAGVRVAIFPLELLPDRGQSDARPPEPIPT